MEYDFPAGLILQPTEYSNGVHPPGSLSDIDKQWAMTWYPGADETPAAHEAQAVQVRAADARVAASRSTSCSSATRRASTQLGTFGSADTVIVLFEDDGGDLRYLTGDDDSGTDRNARLQLQAAQGPPLHPPGAAVLGGASRARPPSCCGDRRQGRLLALAVVEHGARVGGEHRLAGLLRRRPSPWWRPVRPSCGPGAAAASVRTQRILPVATASASHVALTSLSRPEKPPSAATSAPAMTCAAAPDWLETAIVPPPLALA